MEANWNSGMDYGFSAIKSMMRILGLWPLQRDDALATFRWFVMFMMGSLTMVSMLIKTFKSCDIPKDVLDIIRMTEACIHGWLNLVFSRIYMRRMAVNVNCAIDDWSSTNDGESRTIMTTYARLGRMVTLMLSTIGFVAVSAWFVFLGNKHEVVSTGNDTAWIFVLPSTCLYRGVSYSTYKALFALQVIQNSIVLLSQCACDSFLFGITMHLCGQLELLRDRFNDIDRERDDEKRHGSAVGPLVRRHCRLITLAKNIDDTFNINILMRLLIVSVLMATSGVGFIVSFRQHDHKEMIKMLLSMQCYIVQTFLFIHAGETLQTQSESMVTAIHDTTWHELSATTMKDLIFVIMRVRIPLQLSAGKFVYLTRTTMTDILKTTLTYISFLQVTIDE